MVTYHEVLELVLGAACDASEAWVPPVILGGHGRREERGNGAQLPRRDEPRGPHAAARPRSDATARALAGQLERAWAAAGQRRTRLGGCGRGPGSLPEEWIVPEAPTDHVLRDALATLLWKAGILRAPGRSARRWAHRPRDLETAFPQARDRRRAHAFRALWGHAPLLWRGEIVERRPQPQRAAHVYLDVSGSVWDVLPPVAGALLRAVRNGDARLYAFSTVVSPIAGLRERPRAANTGGTSIHCVLDHVRSIPAHKRPKHVVVVTDGFVGTVAPGKVAPLGAAFHVGLVGTARDRHLPWAGTVVQLPDPRRGGPNP